MIATPMDFDELSCPLPNTLADHIQLGHGSGGKLTNDLIKQLFLPAFDNNLLSALEDQATIQLNRWTESKSSSPFDAARLAFTTDSFVVRPLFFPGGDIGQLAVHGTVNDLAVGGAEPKFLSAAFILEEGLPLTDLARIVISMKTACEAAGVQMVTGDTKVVDRGKGDGVFITTSGIGIVPAGRSLSIRHVQPGDCILVSGTVGDHGMSIMSVREGLEFTTVLKSDNASLNSLTRAMLAACPGIHWMRDPTRGGVAAVLNELVSAVNLGVKIEETALPVRPEVRAACEMLGMDPLYVANEGKLIAVVPPDQTDRLLNTMREHPLGANAAILGEVTTDHPGIVVMKSVIGGERIVTMPAGEQLPRIC
ncbi:hydrogenase expression/formation protein HypE [Thalassoroseus pseudoceratinae]|uniref:hydrogenase expression/formation protein HypE n=1 Tax=Thalassoroseus pseudoceratinae TaxID=2713176 RepID=UPI001F0EFFDE|nr:hydrogenase expression/formation protein HypE [Thalassoroseus pseudoceratinae]